MSDGGRIGKPAAADPAAADLAPQETPLVPRKSGLFGASRMDAVNAERREVAQSLDRRMAAMRKASGPAAEAAAIPKGGGSGLPDAVRARMEPRLGADLSGVKVHTAGESAQAASQLGARAFTVGSDVHFNAGEFAPGSKEGDKLLAHELTHVVQGQRSGVQRKPEPDAGGGGGEGADAAGGEHAAGGEGGVSHPDEPAEKEADGVSEKVADDLHGDKKKHAGGEHGADAHGGGAGGAGKHAEAGGGGGAAGGDKHAAEGAGGDSKPKEAPAPIAAKYIGVGNKIFRSPDPAKAGAAPAGPAPAAPAAAGSAAAGPAAAQGKADFGAGVLNQPGMTPELSVNTPQCIEFKARFASLQQSLQMPVNAAEAEAIWLQTAKTLASTDAAYAAAPAADASNPKRKDLSADAFKKIMVQFEPITAALQPYMEKWAKGKKVWAFWSGAGACDVAKANAEVSLEKSALGGLFDQININGGWDTAMWAALSKAYASAAAKNVEQKTYRGFVGQGASAEQSIFNKVEQPQFTGMLDQKQAASLKVTWYAVATDAKIERGGAPDPTCNVGGMEGVMGTSADRNAMVQLAESVNPKRKQLFKQTGKVVPVDQVDAAMAAAESSKDAAGGKAADGAGGGGDKNKAPAPNAAPPAPAAAPAATAASGSAAGQKLPPPAGGGHA